MKNKIFTIIFVLCFFSLNLSYSKIIKFESPEIEIENDGKRLQLKMGYN